MNFSRNNAAQTKSVLPIGTGLVHASRVIHVAEDILDDEVYGIPRLEPLYNYLDDLLKVVGGSAEMFWLDAKRRLVFSLRDEYTTSPEMEATIAGRSGRVYARITQLRAGARGGRQGA